MKKKRETPKKITKMKQATLPSYFTSQLVKANNWTPGFANHMIRLYQEFLQDRSDNPLISPTDDIDKVWHQHILNTKNYHNYCLMNFGRTVDHDPNDSFDQIARKQRIWKRVTDLPYNDSEMSHMGTEEYQRRLKNYIAHQQEEDPLFPQAPSAPQQVKILWFRDRYVNGKFLDKRGVHPVQSFEGKWNNQVLNVPAHLKTVGDLGMWIAKKVGRTNSIGTDIYIPQMFETEAPGSKASLGDEHKLNTLPRHLLAVLEETSSHGYC